jgi:hypothetical protein
VACVFDLILPFVSSSYALAALNTRFNTNRALVCASTRFFTFATVSPNNV